MSDFLTLVLYHVIILTQIFVCFVGVRIGIPANDLSFCGFYVYVIGRKPER